MAYFGQVRTLRGVKRLECVELAPAFGVVAFDESTSELDALIVLPKLFTGGEGSCRALLRGQL